MLGNFVGRAIGMEGEEVSIVVDVKSEEEKNRTLHLFHDKMQSPVFFYGLPSSVKMGIVFANPASVEFVSFEELGESCVWDGRGFGYSFRGEEV